MKGLRSWFKRQQYIRRGILELHQDWRAAVDEIERLRALVTQLARSGKRWRDELTAAEDEIERLRAENATLREQLADTELCLERLQIRWATRP